MNDNATYTKALRYQIEVTCLSPLRSGGTDRNLEQILRGWDGTPFLQGTSLAGALKAWLPDKALLGDTDGTASSLIVSDVLFPMAEEPVVRPRLCMDGETGTGKDSGKFDIAALPAGTTGHFQLVWTGHEDPKPVANQIEQYLSAMNSGLIRLGAQKSNGFGRVALRVRKRTYDLMDGNDLTAWLKGDDIPDAQEVTLTPIQEKGIVFHVEGYFPQILVKSSTSEESEEVSTEGNQEITRPKFVQMKENDQMIVPGSSLKGAIRAQLKRIVQYIPNVSIGDIERFMGRGNSRQDNGIAGKLWFSDGILDNPMSVTHARIRIDRFTGSVLGNGLFSQQVVGGQLKFTIHIPEGQELASGLILYALRDLGLGLYNLGSSGAIGFGHADCLQVKIQSGGDCAVMDCDPDRVMLTDPQGLVQRWQELLGGEAK